MGLISGLFSRYSLYAVILLVVSNFVTYELLQSQRKSTQICKMESKFQDQAVEALALDYEKRLKERKTVTVREVQTKLKVVYRDNNISTKECNEITSTINAIRSSDL